MRKKSSKSRNLSKGIVTINTLARDLIREFKDVKSFIEKFNGFGEKAGKFKQVYQELTMAYLFTITHSIETALSAHPKEEELLNRVHTRAYACLELSDTDFNGPEYEQTLGKRYKEFRKIIKSQSDALFKLGERIAHHIWAGKHEDKFVYMMVIGTWLGSMMVHNKEFLDEVTAEFDIK